MALITHIVQKALQNAGVYVSEGDGVPGDYLNPCYDMLQDIVAEMNAQSAIVFEQGIVSTTVQGDTITFKKYTEEEQAIIDGGGTVNITDRIVDFVPVQYPTGLTVSETKLRFVSLSDVALYQNTSQATCYAFQKMATEAKIVFDAPLRGSMVKFVINKPIEIDNETTGEIHIPPAYDHLFVTKLAEAASLRYQFTESASLFAQKGSVQANALANNVTSIRPLKHKTASNLNRFRR